MCHVPPIMTMTGQINHDSWQATSSFRRFGASNGATPFPWDQPFGRYSRKCLNTHWLTDWQTRSGHLFFTDPPEEIFVHRTFNAKAFECSFTTILDYYQGRSFAKQVGEGGAQGMKNAQSILNNKILNIKILKTCIAHPRWSTTKPKLREFQYPNWIGYYTPAQGRRIRGFEGARAPPEHTSAPFHRRNHPLKIKRKVHNTPGYTSTY